MEETVSAWWWRKQRTSVLKGCGDDLSNLLTIELGNLERGRDAFPLATPPLPHSDKDVGEYWSQHPHRHGGSSQRQLSVTPWRPGLRISSHACTRLYPRILHINSAKAISGDFGPFFPGVSPPTSPSTQNKQAEDSSPSPPHPAQSILLAWLQPSLPPPPRS